MLIFDVVLIITNKNIVIISKIDMVIKSTDIVIHCFHGRFLIF